MEITRNVNKAAAKVSAATRGILAVAMLAGMARLGARASQTVEGGGGLVQSCYFDYWGDATKSCIQDGRIDFEGTSYTNTGEYLQEGDHLYCEVKVCH